jgi:phosphatidylserine/phosphatidylglycerophosphate/cardiolipin synthase-like enzyme
MMHIAVRGRKRFSYLLTVAAALYLLSAPRVDAREQLCDPSYQNCRTPLIDLINAETVEIDVGLWFMEDARYSSAIVQRWKAGVKVRILMDPRVFPQDAPDVTVMNQLQVAGIPMRKRIASGIEHWKAMIFAGQRTVYFGSANFSDEAFVPASPYVNYVDETVYVTDDATVVNSFMRKFDDAWIDTTNYANYANSSGTLVRSYAIYSIDPELNFPPDQDYAARSVKEYNLETRKIDVMMFRITDRRHTDAIIAAHARGVAIRLMVDHDEYRLPERLWDAWNVDRLYAAGIPIRWNVHQGVSHGKLVLLYGLGETIFGSSNWSSPSAASQHEHNYFTTKTNILNWFVTYFERRWNNSNPLGVPESAAFAPLPPDKPVYKSPASGATGIGTASQKLAWDGGPWAHNYDIYFGTSSPPPLLAANQNLGPDDPTAPSQQKFALPTLQPGTTYYWQIVSKTMANQTKAGSIWSFTTAGTPPHIDDTPPAPWLSADIGLVPVAGSAGYSGGTFTIKGSGADIWGTADAFHFVYRTMTGDSTIVARVASIQNVNAWSKGGVMIRETLSAGSKQALMLVSAGKGAAFQRRQSTGGDSVSTPASASAPPHWVALQRRGSTIIAYESSDGSTWTAVGTDTISMASTVFVGLAVTSHTTSSATTALIDGVYVSSP